MKKKISFSSELKNLDLVEKFINTICEYEEIDEKHYGNILIAVTEGANNALNHGNRLNPSKNITIEYAYENSELLFRVSDEGPGFDFENIPDPTLPENIEKVSGRGIFLIKNLADSVDFIDNGSTIEMKFRINGAG